MTPGTNEVRPRRICGSQICGAQPDSAKALALEADFRNHIRDLIASDTFPVEVTHALTKAERRGLLLTGEAEIRQARIRMI